MSGKITSNGRSSYQELKKKFSKVFLSYKKNEDGSVRTTAYLVSENAVHVGVSLFSARGKETFNKSRGRQMALGRAELAFNIASGKESARKSHESRRQELSFSVLASSEISVESIIESLLE